VAEAAAWLQPEGKGQFFNNHFFYTTDTFVDVDGNRVKQPRFTKYEDNPYVEYGLFENLTIGLNTFIHYVTQEQSVTFGNTSTTFTTDNYGIADTEIFARFPLHKGDSYIVSAQPLIKLPSYYSADHSPKAGTEDLDFEIALQGGYSFRHHGLYHFTFGEVFYRKRNGILFDQIGLDLGLGYKLTERLTLLPQFFSIFAFNNNGQYLFSSTGAGDSDLIKLQFTAFYQVNRRVFLQTGLFNHVWARNTGSGTGLIFSVGYNF
jgi:hypothetical protein